MTDESKTIKLEDYRRPDFEIPEVNLEVLIQSENDVTVRSTMQVEAANPQASELELRGDNQNLLSVKVDGRELSTLEYTMQDGTLAIPNVPQNFTLQIESEIDPAGNEALSGLYKSGDILATQCESEGFRRITFHPDRPDVMGVYTTRIEADKKDFPVLLSNGNLVDEGDLPGGRHYTVWEDPFKKPSYLFALVAGDLGKVADTFTTMNGRDVAIEFYVDKGAESKALFAVDALKKAMKWDEDTFGFECDLDQYMVVAVDSFVFGAMENKGLNIFNSKYVLVDPETATDQDFENVLGVVGHEYFHNITGNRITVENWHLVALKEGLTSYRDQRFTSDLGSETVDRIKNVRVIKNAQFPEDSGPNSHPIIPSEVMKIENFYTTTVYRKGTEVNRMIATLIGEDGFAKGMTKYLELFDGQAVSIDDYVHAMELGSGKDLTQFRRWYHQAGTPTVTVETDWDQTTQLYRIRFKQSNPTKDGQEQDPLHIPVRFGLVAKDGTDLVSTILELTNKEQAFFVTGIDQEVVPSLFRGFSAPVKVDYDYTDEELAFLMANDSDEFNRYDAGQRMAAREILRLMGAGGGMGTTQYTVSQAVLDSFGAVLDDKTLDPGFVAQVLAVPAVDELVEQMVEADFVGTDEAREHVRRSLALEHEQKFKDIYTRLDDGKPFSSDMEAIGRRSLKNAALSYLVATGKDEYAEVAFTQFQNADNMTDRQAALYALAGTDHTRRQEALDAFYADWKDNPLVMDKWLMAQSRFGGEDALDAVRQLESDPVYDAKVPNRVYSLIGGFAANPRALHADSGEGYKFLADKIIEFDAYNPSLSSRFAKSFKKFASMDDARKGLMRSELERVLAAGPSEQLYEIVSSTLDSE